MEGEKGDSGEGLQYQVKGNKVFDMFGQKEAALHYVKPDDMSKFRATAANLAKVKGKKVFTLGKGSNRWDSRAFVLDEKGFSEVDL